VWLTVEAATWLDCTQPTALEVDQMRRDGFRPKPKLGRNCIPYIRPNPKVDESLFTLSAEAETECLLPDMCMCQCGVRGYVCRTDDRAVHTTSSTHSRTPHTFASSTETETEFRSTSILLCPSHARC